MQVTDYPALYQAADSDSKSAQKKYLSLMAADLGLMTFAALLCIYNFNDGGHKMWVYLIGGAMLVLGLILTLLIKILKYEDRWYQGRALAESVKSISWKFMTCAEGFEAAINTDEVKQKFIKRIEEFATKFSDYTKHFDSKLLILPSISPEMNKQRLLLFEERKRKYLQQRIEDQKKWYSGKATFNQRKHNLYFSIVVLAQLCAILSSYYLIMFPNSNWNLVGFFTTLASVSIAWLQLKHHQELKQAYTTAAMELQFIEEKSQYINTENEWARFVFDSENAISREHTLWLAQKRK